MADGGGLRLPENTSHSKKLKATNRIAAHTHIEGLGLDSTTGRVLPGCLSGMVGQEEAREAAGLLIDLIKAKKLAGKSALLAGPPGTGKTAIALGISRDLGSRVPFCAISAAEVYSQEVKKTEVLMECLRRAIGLRIREVKDVYEGEVLEMSIEEQENPHGGYAKCMSGVVLTLKSSAGTKTLKLAPQIHEGLQSQKVSVGDVIFIQAQTGYVKRLGRCDVYAAEVDLDTEEFVPLPKGEVYKTKEIVQDVTLYDLDLANSKPEGSSTGLDVATMISQYLTPRKTEITERLRREVDKVVDKYITEGLAELTPGVVFIDECHMLDLECYSFLNRVIESEHAPVLILATNRGMSTIRGSGTEHDEPTRSPHGIPMDFLDRVLIIKTIPYTLEEAVKIIGIRSRIEGCELTPDALRRLGEIGETTSLRYANQLLGPASIIARSREGDDVVTELDVEEADALYLDAKASAKRLIEQKHLFA